MNQINQKMLKKYKSHFRYFILIFLLLISCDSKPKSGQEKKELHQTDYKNPVLDKTFADPTVIRGHDGRFYAYATQDNSINPVINIQVSFSTDLVNWSEPEEALPIKPVWANDSQNFWAPHVIYDSILNKYYMYYSGQANGVEDKYLGVATSDSPVGPFTDVGVPLLAGEGFVNIDPMAYDDPSTGKKLLYWGSGFEPIKVRELRDDRLSFRHGALTEELIFPGQDKEYGILVEGAWIDYNDGLYYMYYSGDNCCGENANYAVMVARSEKATGPFTRLGESNGTQISTILEKNQKWLAPGHNSIVRDDAGDPWIFYHAIDPENRYNPSLNDPTQNIDRRVLLMDRVRYENGWPKINNGTPSIDSIKGPQTY